MRFLLYGLLIGNLFISSACSMLGPGSAADDEESPATVNMKLGIGYIQTGRLDLAQSKLKKALDYDPELAEAHNALGVLYEQGRNGKLAEKHYSLALQIKPEYTLARMNYGRLLCANGNASEGEKQFLIASRDSDFTAPEIAFTGAGVCARSRENLPLAETYFSQALEANPYAIGTLYEMASLNYARQRYRDAQEYLLRYHKQAGYNPTSLNLAIKIEDALGDKKLRDQYDRLLRSQTKPNA